MHELVPIAQDGRRGRARRRRHLRRRRSGADRPGSKIGMVFQKPNPFPTMSIYENVISGLEARRHQADGDRTRSSRSALTRSGLWNEVKDRLKSPGGALSGGQQQRLCIARALAVAAGGAPDGRAVLGARPELDACASKRRSARSSHEVTIVIVTHNMQQAQRVSDALRVLPRGRGAARPHRRGRPHDRHLREPQGSAHRGLRERPLRLSRGVRFTANQEFTLTSPSGHIR